MGKFGAGQMSLEDWVRGSARSAREIIPVVFALLQPKSVVDIGCGGGSWLSVCREIGVDEIFGVDGNYVDDKLFQIPKECFAAYDLRKPFRLGRRFDLVISLEVTEQLPGRIRRYICRFSHRALGMSFFFRRRSASRRRVSYKRTVAGLLAQIFQERGYVVVDCIRKRIWQNPNVEGWYAQNMLMYCSQG